jgi:prepilin-type N-terminal cleavage/methylation domain-containing protein
MAPAGRFSFTLVELLVVIAILLVLGSIVIAAAEKSRDQALRTQCSDNMRHIGLALYGYHDAQPGWVI